MPLGRSSDLSVDIGGDASGFERAAKSAEAATARASRAALEYDTNLAKLGADIARLEKQIDDDLTASLQRQHDAMDKTGKGLVTFGTGVAIALGLAGKAAMDWESAWAGVTKTTSGTPEQMAQLEQQLRQLAKTLPSTHEEIAAVAEAAGQLGVQRQSIAAFTKVMIDLGQTTNLTAEDAATQIAQLMNVMRSAPEDVDNLGAALVALGNNGASTEADILSMAQRLSGAGALIGAEETDVLALASAMADLGIQSELGGGAASRALTKMYAAVKSGGEVLEGFASTAGMTGDEFARAFSEDPMRALDAFVKGLGRVDEQGGNVIAALDAVGLEGTQNAQVLLRLSGAGDRLTESLELSAQAWAENTALLAEAEKRYGTTESKAKIAGNTLRDNAIDIGNYLLPMIAGLSDGVADLSAFFGDLPGPVKATLTVLAALAAAAALAGGAMLIAVPKAAAFKAAVEGLEAGALKTAGTRLSGLAGVLMGPWGIALAAGATALTIFAAKQGEAAREVDALRATLDEQTGALTENSREWAVKKLADSGALQLAKDLGLDLQQVTDAALGNKDAIAGVNDELKTFLALGAPTDDSGQFTGVGKDAKELQGILLDTNGIVARGREEWQLMNEATGGAAAGTDKAANAAEGAGQAAAGMAAGLQDGADAAAELGEEVKTLGQQLEDLSAGFLDERSASRAVRESLREVRKALKDYRDEHGNMQGAFKRGTKSGDNFAEMLDGLAKNYQQKIDATQRATGSEERAQQVLEASRAKLIRVARQLGMSREEARAYANQVLKIPETANTDVRANTAQAEAAVSRLRSIYAGLPRYIETQAVTRHIDKYERMTGGGHADGGYITGPGGPRDDKIVARLSNGEFVVNAESTRRNRGLLEAINAKRYADGGFVGDKATGIDTRFLIAQLGVIPGTPSLRPYTAAVREQARALRDLREMERALATQRKQARAAERAADRKGATKADKRRAAAEARDVERAEKRMEKAKDAHAKATDRVKSAVSAYADAQAAAVSRAQEVANRAASGGSIFGGDFSDPRSVSQRIQATMARVREFIGIRRQLVAKGIHPSLLAQLDDEGPTEGAIMFGRALLANARDFAALNRQSAALESTSAQLGADTAALHGPTAGREVRAGRGAGNTVVVQVQVNAPQNMNPDQVGGAVASRIVAGLR